MARRDYSSSDYSSRSSSRSRSRSRSTSRGRSPYSRRKRSRSYSSRSYSSRSYSSRSYSSSSVSVKANEKKFWVCVSPISANVSPDHLKEICSMFGKVKDVSLSKTQGRFINGYVEMYSQKDLSDVVSHLSGGSIDGFTISVKEVDDPNGSISEKYKENYRKYSRSPVHASRRYSRSPIRNNRRYSRSPLRKTQRYSRSPIRVQRRYSRSPPGYKQRYSRSPRRISRSRSPRRFSRSPKRTRRGFVEKELDEGDITVKGFEKKKKKLLEQFSYLFESENSKTGGSNQLEDDKQLLDNGIARKESSPEIAAFTGVSYDYTESKPQQDPSRYSNDSKKAEYFEALHTDKGVRDSFFLRDSYIQEPSIGSDDTNSVIDLTVGYDTTEKSGMDDEKDEISKTRPHSDFFDGGTDMMKQFRKFSMENISSEGPESPAFSNEEIVEHSPQINDDESVQESPLGNFRESIDSLNPLPRIEASTKQTEILLGTTRMQGGNIAHQDRQSFELKEALITDQYQYEGAPITGKEAIPLVSSVEIPVSGKKPVDNQFVAPLRTGRKQSHDLLQTDLNPGLDNRRKLSEDVQSIDSSSGIRTGRKQSQDIQSVDQNTGLLRTGKKLGLESSHSEHTANPGMETGNFYLIPTEYQSERKGSLLSLESNASASKSIPKDAHSFVAHERKQSLDKESNFMRVAPPIQYPQQTAPLQYSQAVPGNYQHQYEQGRNIRAPAQFRPAPRGYPNPNNFQAPFPVGMAPPNFNQPLRYIPPQEYHHARPPYPSSYNPQIQYSLRPQNSNTVTLPNRITPQLHDPPRLLAHTAKQEFSAPILTPEPVPKDVVAEDESGKLYSEFDSIGSILQSRAMGNSRNNLAFSFADNRLKHIDAVTYESLHLKAVRYATYFTEKLGCLPGSSVGLLFKTNEYPDFLGALFGCVYSGLIAVPIVTHSFHSNDEFLEIVFVLSHSKSAVAVLGDHSSKIISRFLSRKDVTAPQLQWVKTSEVYSFRKNEDLNIDFQLVYNDIAYLEYTKSSSGDLKGIAMSHKVVINQCRILKTYQSVTSQDILLTCMELRQGFGLLFGAFLALFTGFHTYTVPNDMCQFPGLWMIAVSRFKATVCLCQPLDLLAVITSLGKYVPGRKDIIDLSCIKHLFLDTISPNPDFSEDIYDAFSGFGLAGSHVVIPILSLHEFGGISISIPQYHLRNNGYVKPKTVIIDAKTTMELKVSVLSIGEENSMDEYSPGLLRVTESGHLVREGIMVIVNPETSAILPPNSIGELWICSSEIFPGYFWALPIHTDKYMRAKPIYFSKKNESDSIGFDVEVEQVVENESTIYKHTLKSNFIRTGLIGFILDKYSTPSSEASMFFVICKRQDIIMQKAPANNSISESKQLKHYFFSNHLSRTFHKFSYGINVSVFFNLSILEDFITILVLEVSRNDDNGPLLQKILKFAYLNLNLKIFSVLICAPGSLPRLLPDRNVDTMLHTSYLGFSSDIIYCAMPPSWTSQTDRSYYSAKKRLLISEQILCNSEACKKAFISGNLLAQIGYLNCIPQVIGSIMFSKSKYDEMIFQRDPRPAQIVSSYRNVNVLDDYSGQDLHGFPTISHLLEWRVNRTPDERAYVLIDSRGRESKILTYRKFSQKAYAIAAFLRKKYPIGTHVIVMMTLGLEFMITIHACLFCGLIPIPMSPPDANRLKEDIPALIAIMGEFQVTSFLVNAPVDEDLRGRVISAAIRAGCNSDSEVKVAFPEILLVTKMPRVNKEIAISDQLYHNMSMVSLGSNPAIILVSYSADMQISINALSHAQIVKECSDQIKQHNMLRSVQGEVSEYIDQHQPSCRPLMACVRSFNGLGFLFSAMLGIYSGSFTLVISPFDFFLSPHIWFDTIYRYSVKDAFVTYPMLDHALSTLTDVQYRSFSLHNLENLIIYTEGRSKPELEKVFIEKMAGSRLDPDSLCPFYSSNIHPMVATRSFAPSKRAALWVSTEALRRNFVEVIHECYGQDIYNNLTPRENALLLLDSGLPCQDSSIAIVNPETWCVCGPGECGEIWVSTTWNCPGYSEGFTIKNLETQFRYFRTGDRGFLWPVPKVIDGEEMDPRSGWKSYFEKDSDLSLSLFVIGPYSRELIFNGIRYPIDDLERTVERCSSHIPVDGCIIFPHNSSTICSVEIDKPEHMIITANQISIALLKRHRIAVDTIAFVQVGFLAKSRMKEKQRSKVAIAYHLGKLPIEALIHTH